jgi:hypothetical protein
MKTRISILDVTHVSGSRKRTYSHVMEELKQINVVAGALEILLQEEEDAGFQDEGVVDGDGTNAILAVPTGLTATGDRGIHHIVSNKEVGLQLKTNETRCGARA